MKDKVTFSEAVETFRNFRKNLPIDDSEIGILDLYIKELFEADIDLEEHRLVENRLWENFH